MQKNDETGSSFKQQVCGPVIVENLPDLISKIDPDGVLTYVSPAVKQLLGYEPEELAGRSALDFFHLDDLKSLKKAFRETTRKRSTAGITGRCRRKDGGYIWLETTVHACRESKTGDIKEVYAVSRDVSERKKIENELQESDEKYRSLFENMRDGFALCRMIYDKTGHPEDCVYIAVNPAFGKLTGLKNVVWKKLTEVVPGIKETNPEVLELYGRVALTGTPEKFEAYIKQLDIWFSVSVYSPKKDHFVAIFDNITDRKRSESELKEREQALKRSQSISHVGHWSWDTKTNRLKWSEEMYRIFGVDKDKFTGDLNDIIESSIHPDDREMVKRSNEGVIKDKKHGSLEYRVIRPDGSVRNIWAQAADAVRDKQGNVINLSGVVQDITERKQVEENLRRAQEFNKALLENLNDGVVACNSEGILTLFNRTARQWHGMDALALPPSKWAEHYDLFGPDGVTPLDTSQVPLAKAFLGETVRDSEMTIAAKGQPPRHVLANGTPFYDASKKKLGAVAVMRDITEKKQLDAHKLQLEKLEALGFLAGGIAHDFNNILTHIAGNISVAKRDMENGTELFKLLEDAEKGVVQATSLTRQLLTFAKGGEPVKEISSVKDIVMNTANFALIGSNCKAEFSIQKDVWAVLADTGQLGQVIDNVVINARQAMKDGGLIQLSITNHEALEDDKSLARGSYVCIKIRDNGCGISAENLERMFEPYFTTKEKSSGLGLAASYSIVKKHGGTITINSKVNEGTTVEIYLPAFKSRKAEEPSRSAKVFKGSGRVLVMDDEDPVRRVIGRMLNHIGYDVGFASNGQEALSEYKKSMDDSMKYDAVILDLTIRGGMGGKATFEEIRKLDSGAKVIVSSGYSADSALSEYKKLGFKTFLSKPYTLERLSEVVKDVIEEK